MKLILSLSLFSILMTSVTFASSEPVKYVVKGAICTNGSWFNAAESIPVGSVISGLTAEELRKAIHGVDGAFFLRGDERNLFIKFKSGKNFEYKSGRAPCDNESWSLISLEKLIK